MLSNIIITVLAVFLVIMGIRVMMLESELLDLQNPDSKSSDDEKNDKKKSPQYNDGDWMVKLRKPKREMVVAGCNTEGEVVRQIILLGHRPDEVRKITRL